MSKRKLSLKEAGVIGRGDNEETLVAQGVILADSFNQRMLPVTLEQPRALLPLANQAALDYTIEFLASAGVRQIFVYCCSHAEKIEAHVSRWWQGKAAVGRQVTVECISSRNQDAVSSAGDALRDIHDRELIVDDFILVSGDVISNMKLDQVLADHKRRRRESSGYIMTSVFKKATPAHRSRANEDDTIVALNPASGKLLYYGNDRRQSSVEVELKMFQEHPSVQFRYDLIDCHIDICAPQVLFLYKDNFDFRTIRGDFVRGMIDSVDMSHSICVNVIDGEYAARVRNLHTYAAVSRDIVRRWCYPLAPDNNVFGATTFRYQRGNIYIEGEVKLARSCVVGNNSVVGADTVIGEGARVSNSILGPNCRIAKNAVVEGAFLWRGVHVGEGATVRASLLADNVRVGARCTVPPGSVISYNVVIGDDVALPSLVMLATADAVAAAATRTGGGGGSAADAAAAELLSGSDDGALDSFGSLSASPGSPALAIIDAAIAATAAAGGRGGGGDGAAASLIASRCQAIDLGVGGYGVRWTSGTSFGDGDDDYASSSSSATTAAGALAGSPSQHVNSLVYNPMARIPLHDSDISSSDDEQDDNEYVADLSPFERFQRELEQLTIAALEDSWDVSDAIVQMKALRMTEDRSFIDCTQVAVPVLLRHFVCSQVAGANFAAEHSAAASAALAPKAVTAVASSSSLSAAAATAAPSDFVADESETAATSSPAAAGSGSDGDGDGDGSSAASIDLGTFARNFGVWVAHWTPLLKLFCPHVDDQVELILLMQEFCDSNKIARPLENTFQQALHALYHADVLEEDAIFDWQADQQQNATEEEMRFLQSCMPLITWLRTAEEDSSGDDDDDEDEDSDDDLGIEFVKE
jgi:NDP-sugar pyrophosphorylase family protein